MCFKCLVEIGVHSDSSNYITCPICRHKSHVDSIHYARRNREDEEPNIVVKGLFSSKIKCITLKLMELIAQDPNVKVVVFSSVSNFDFFFFFLLFNILSQYLEPLE